MLRTLLISLTLICAPFIAQAAHPGPATTYDALVMLHIDGLDDAKLARLSAIVAREEMLTLEYSCTWGDGVVLHVEGSSFSEKADVITFVRRFLGEAGITTGVEFLHVHVEAGGTGKC